MTKRSYNPVVHLEGFFVGIFQDFRDKGMSKNASYKRLLSTVYSSLSTIYRKGDNRNQNMAHHMKEMDRTIYHYGIDLTKEVEKQHKDGGQPTKEVLETLSQLKQLREQLNSTIKKTEELGGQYE